MATCPNCSAPLEDDARFCPNCGAAIVPEEAAPYVPEDPVPAPEAPPPAPEAPSPAFEPAPAPETGFCPNCGEMVLGGTDYCEHCGAPLHADGGQPQKKTGGSGAKKWMILGGIVVVAAALVVVLISVLGGGGGGKGYGLYLKDGEMYYSNLSKNGAWQFTSKLYEDADNFSLLSSSSSISSRTIMSKDGKTLFFPDRLSGGSGFTLYYRGTASEKKEAAKIDSDVTRYSVNDGASLVTYLKNGNLYQYNLSRDEKEKLASDINGFYVSDDGKKIIYRDEDDTMYQLDSGKEKAKLDSDVDYVRAISDDCKTIVYQKEDILYLKQDGKDKVKIASDVYNVVRAYKTGEAYFTKDDDEITLYYFDGKSSKELTDEFGYATYASSKTPVLVYQDIDDVYWLAAGDKTTELDAEDPSGFICSDDGKSLWYVDEPDRNDEGELYLVSISNGTAKKAEKQDTDVYAGTIIYTDGGRLVYFKDVDDGEGELYVDGKKADDDVYLYSISESESGALLYCTDYNTSKSYGTLKQYSGGKAVNVADDVFTAYFLPNGSILYLTDYSTSRYRGDLYLYKGSKSEKLDEDVVAILAISTTRKYGS